MSMPSTISCRIGFGLTAAILTLSLLLLQVAAQAAGDLATVLLRPDDPATVADGQQLYTEYCASCHGAELQGQPNWRQRQPNGRLPAPPHDASGHTWHHDNGSLFRITKYGIAGLVGGDYQSDMAGYESILSDAEIIAVLSFIKSRWPTDIRRRHDRIKANRQ